MYGNGSGYGMQDYLKEKRELAEEAAKKTAE